MRINKLLGKNRGSGSGFEYRLTIPKYYLELMDWSEKTNVSFRCYPKVGVMQLKEVKK